MACYIPILGHDTSSSKSETTNYIKSKNQTAKLILDSSGANKHTWEHEQGKTSLSEETFNPEKGLAQIRYSKTKLTCYITLQNRPHYNIFKNKCRIIHETHHTCNSELENFKSLTHSKGLVN